MVSKKCSVPPSEPRLRVACEADEFPDPSPAELWDAAEKDAAQRIERVSRQSQFDAQIDDDKPIGLTFISDQHIAPGTPVDFKRMRLDAELVRETPGMYAILGGDGIDNHVKHRAAVLAARSQPDDQWRLFRHYLKIFGQKVLMVVAGNHDAWTNQFAGVDVLKMICQDVGYKYTGFGGTVRVQIGDGRTYTVAARHQYRYNSSFNQTHAVKQWFRLGEEEFDIGCICHHHEAAVETFMARGLPRIAIRPGSYQITSAFSLQFGFNNSTPSCPSVILFPRERRMIPFTDVRDAAEVLTQYRSVRPRPAVSRAKVKRKAA